jgi:cysteinyl-tRNA synthetase
MQSARTAAVLVGALGVRLAGSDNGEIDGTAADLVRRRDAARAAKEWAEADALRAELEAAGWLVEDSAEGTRIRRR